MLMASSTFIYFFYSKASSSNSNEPKQEESSSSAPKKEESSSNSSEPKQEESSSNSSEPKKEESSSTSSEPKKEESSSTSSEPKKRFKYDVFLSFRGEDTRKNFVGHLYQALVQKGIETYKDDEKIEKGERINDQLLKSIQDSRFFIIVFSKTYASSSWCLDELVKIIECQKTAEQTAYPVFYDVEPTEVRKQLGLVGEAFSKHVKKEVAGKWREALKEAADLVGWDLKATTNGDESKLIQIVVSHIFNKLCSINSSADENLVGMEMRINNVLSSLEIGVEDVRTIGIKGIGGGGKTTLARAVFDQISNQFEGKSFVENVREFSKPSLSGLKKLQKQILMDVFSDQNITISSDSSGKNMMRQMLHRKKLLVVLDDVNDIKQLEALSGASDWFKPGSRIIITTRDEQVLVAHQVNFIHTFVHQISLLSPDEALCLFSRYAFGREIPVEGYKDLSGEVVKYADGLPLTIKVLGSFLCGQDVLDWKDALERLKTIPLEATMEKLEISYNGLEEDYKEIFLDIACLLEGWYEDEAIRALESCGFHARNGLRVLKQKSLIKISKYGVLDMHDHIQEMGRHIVRRLHADEPHRHSRLWIDEEIEDILANDLGTQATKCIKLRTEILHVKGLAKLKELRFLSVYSSNNELSGSEDDCYGSDEELDEVSQYLPNSLRFLRWSGYPFWSFPKTFQANNLVGLELHDSNIVQLWEGGEEKVLYKLRFLEMFNLKVRTLDLRLTPNLEMLRIIACEDLVELRMPTESLKLRYINLTLTPNLDKLCLINCHDLVELLMPAESQNLRIFKLNHSKLKTLCLGITPNLEKMILEDCNDLVELHMPTRSLKLRSLKVSHSKLRILKLGNTPNLAELIFEDCNNLVELHMLAKGVNVRSLKLSNSKLRILDLRITPKLEELILENCKYLVKLHLPAECLYLRSFKISDSNLRIVDDVFTPASCLNLVSLDLSYTLLRNLDLRITPNLKMLSLKDCPDLIEHMPSECPQLISISHSKLRTLHLGNSRNLVDVHLTACKDLTELYMPTEYLNLVSLTISELKLRTLHQLGIIPNLKSLTIKSCHDLVELHMPTECLNLSSLTLSYLKLKTLDLGLTLTLEMLSITYCEDLVELHMPTECLNLRSLELSELKLETLDLGLTPTLEMLSIKCCDKLVELHMPTECLNLSSFKLSKLKLKTLDLGLTPMLEKLSITYCDDLVELHMPTECLNLSSLKLSKLKLKTLDLGLTLMLEMLSITYCEDLVELHMPTECLNLRSLDLGRLKLTTFHFGLTPTLEKLSIRYCDDLVVLHMPTECQNLSSLELSKLKLKTLDLGLTPMLEMLSITYCADLVELHMPTEYLNLRSLELSKLKLKTLDLGMTPTLEMLSIKYCDNLVELHMPTECLNLRSLELNELKLKTLDLGMTPNLVNLTVSLEHLKKLPKDLGKLECLERLNVSWCYLLQDIPNSICEMKHLKYLNLYGCTRVEKLPAEIGCLECLKELDIRDTRINRLPHSIFQLKGLGIFGYRWFFESCVNTSDIQIVEDRSTVFYSYVIVT